MGSGVCLDLTVGAPYFPPRLWTWRPASSPAPTPLRFPSTSLPIGTSSSKSLTTCGGGPRAEATLTKEIYFILKRGHDRDFRYDNRAEYQLIKHSISNFPPFFPCHFPYFSFDLTQYLCNTTFFKSRFIPISCAPCRQSNQRRDVKKPHIHSRYNVFESSDINRSGCLPWSPPWVAFIVALH